jgi:hypothetical protein
VKSILSEALGTYIQNRISEFKNQLLDNARTLPAQAQTRANAELSRAEKDIRSAAAADTENQKAAFEEFSLSMLKEIASFEDDMVLLLSAAPQAGDSTKTEAAPSSSIRAFRSDDLDAIRAAASELQQRHILTGGDRNWPMTKIFQPTYFAGASKMWLVDPYLTGKHQQRNLYEFLDAVLSQAAIKEVVVTTALKDRDGTLLSRCLAQLDDNWYKSRGCRIVLVIHEEIHDRFIATDTGTIIKLGRGLDIYKPAVGITRPELRMVRECEIDVFRVPAAAQA